MKIYEYNVDKYFKLEKILYGQCFRWNKQEDGKYVGVVGNNVIKIWQQENVVYFYGLNNKGLDAWFEDYFDVQTDYNRIIKEIKRENNNNLLNQIIKYSTGTRILNQDSFEIIVSYIFSASNNIPRITGSIEKLSMLYGKKLEFEGKTYYTFPTIEQLKNVKEEIYKEKIRIGFRAPYVANTIKKLLSEEEYNTDRIIKMDTTNAYNTLLKLDGIGTKVASCILLFSMRKKDVFPVDVWIKRVMQVYSKNEKISQKQIHEIVEKDFGQYSGIINHYMFYWGRENKI